jgi:hypothetical protein
MTARGCKPKNNPADGVFNETGGVVVAALLNMLRLVGAELVLHSSKSTDPTPFEEAVRRKLDQFTSPTNDPEAREAGIECARYLVEQVLTQIRAQATIKKTLASSITESSSDVSTESIPSRLLN